MFMGFWEGARYGGTVLLSMGWTDALCVETNALKKLRTLKKHANRVGFRALVVEGRARAFRLCRGNARTLWGFRFRV